MNAFDILIVAFVYFLDFKGIWETLQTCQVYLGILLVQWVKKKRGRPIIRQLELGLTVKHANLNLRYNTHINILDTIIIS